MWIVRKRIVTIKNFYSGRRLQDVVNPLTLKLPKMRSARIGHERTAAGHEGDLLAGMERVPLKISNHHNQVQIKGASPDSNKVRNQARNEC